MMVDSFSVEGPQLTVDLILEVTQICCFPFAVDTSEDLLAEIQVYVKLFYYSALCFKDVGLWPFVMF